MARTIATFCVVLIIAAPAFAQSDQATSARLDALFGAHEPYEAFLARLKDAVAADDRRSVATMTAYPLETRIAGTPVTLATEEDFLQRYDELILPAVVAALERQTYATLFPTAEGVMVGDGEIWFGGICDDQSCAEMSVRIIALNPDGTAGGPDETDPGADR